MRRFSWSRMEKSVGREGRSSATPGKGVSCVRVAYDNLEPTFSERSHEHPLHLLLLRSDKLQRQTGGAGTSRSARSMDVGIGSTRKLVVHDVRNRRDVESTRSDVRGEKDAIRRRFEPEERAVSRRRQI